MPRGTTTTKRGGNGENSASTKGKVEVVYERAREDASTFPQQMHMHADEIQSSLDGMKGQHIARKNVFACMGEIREDSEANFEALFEAYPALLDNVVRHRLQEVENTHSTVKSHTAELRKSRMKLMANAKSHLDEGREKQRLAMDADAFIKHYKALLLST
ncbi:hypothetical protein BJ138DRAFT_319135 [Hygrophoropsis aurantiaca]|uniref:Uncharacterized protein n=1 Tax=Hygrophoropsis aurantiaca TaxID=72124 RepID=A0ACB8A6Z3_9AGAM|nr:hypothetical protein BJ138DRAFT_319135 [Hygrophoropsis aurantiaca]